MSPPVDSRMQAALVPTIHPPRTLSSPVFALLSLVREPSERLGSPAEEMRPRQAFQEPLLFSTRMWGNWEILSSH